MCAIIKDRFVYEIVFLFARKGKIMLLDININKLTKLIKSFYRLTKIKIAIFDDAFNEIFTYPEEYSPFCEMVNRRPDIHKKCSQNVKELCERCRSEKKLVTFTCHAGLTEAVAPLYEGNITIGYIMFGQITDIKSKTDFAQKARYACRSYGLSEEEFNEKIKLVPYKNKDQIEAVSEIVNALTSYIYMMRIVSMKKEETLASIVDYIENNLSSDLSVSAICEKFSLSKTVLYELTSSAMPGGIAKYIRDKRIETAKLLISKTDRSIEEISGLVGFLDSNYFRRIFKRTSGMSANAYRKKMS